MTFRSASLRLQDFADATNLPLSALSHPIEKPGLPKPEKPCEHCEARRLEHIKEVNDARQVSAKTSEALLTSLADGLQQLRNEISASHATIIRTLLEGFLPGLSQASLRDAIRTELEAGLKLTGDIILEVPPSLDMSNVEVPETVIVKTMSDLPADSVRVRQGGKDTQIDVQPLIEACLERLDVTISRVEP